MFVLTKRVNSMRSFSLLSLSWVCSFCFVRMWFGFLIFCDLTTVSTVLNVLNAPSWPFSDHLFGSAIHSIAASVHWFEPSEFQHLQAVYVFVPTAFSNHQFQVGCHCLPQSIPCAFWSVHEAHWHESRFGPVIEFK